ncbi:hypothetical protein BGX27_011504 [Mortierella sp. AM989]|nr:hypothetical protein BGX27_011504 [Mortierella sp. AM989]
MFLDPVYIQSRILADGYTALIVCTLRWNSQPQPYYLNTNTWTVTLAIGTSDTTPPSSSSSSNGWGVIPGGGPMLPPAGFRHFSLAILGQDKAVIMFGNAGKLAKVTRGSVAYPVSRTLLDIFPGNGGGSNTAQDIGVYDANLNTVSMLSGVTGGPRNTIFRGAAVIGQGQQIFVHGGLRTLEFGSSSPLLDYLDQSVGVWNGDTQQWGDTVNIVVPKKSKTLMIGLIAGGVVLVVLIALGVWYFRKRQRIRRLEEEERQTKGMVLKNEDKLQKEHRASRQNNNENGTPPAAHGPAILHHNQIGMTGSEVGIYNPLHQPAHGYVESFTVGRNSTAELYHQNAHQSHVEYPYAEAELIDEVAAVEISKSRAVNNPQEFPTKNSNGAGMYGDISRAPSHYQAVVSVAGQPVYGMPSYGVSKQEHNEQESPQLTEDLQNLGKLRASQDASRTSLDPLPTRSSYTIPSSADIRASLYSQAVSTGSRPSAAAARDSYTSAHPYSNASSTSFTPQIASQMTPYMSSPTFSATYSVPDSMQGSDTAHPSLMRSNPSAGDLMDQSAHMYSYPSQTKTSVDPNAVPYQMTEAFSNSQPAIPYQSRP